ncbi:peptidoglycan-binding domain-containing protein [Microbacterium helvum]|uniref:peptidoglycan-binding domain-containing protein n=1 Tax=Microbacterium helvum TaxID=2773713 RepID=UPI0029655A86|nr:peptidoglycan-binding domain-containing protein [Microbacterium helvum]
MTTDNGARSPTGRRRRRWPAIVRWCTAIAVTAVVTWWATSTALARPESVAAVDDPQTTTVTQVTLGRTVSTGVTVAQPTAPIAVNLLAGVVTVTSTAATIEEGASLYAVNGIPVIALQAATPFYRDFAASTRGSDVAELQRALTRLGYFTAAADGVFGASTAAAVKAWQRVAGAPVTGEVHLGEAVGVSALPIALRLGDDIRPGALLAGGEDALIGPVGERTFSITLSPDRARLIPTESDFVVHSGANSWPARVIDTTVDEGDNLTLVLRGPDGGAVCADACASLPMGERLILRAEAVVTPEQTGPGVAASAIRTAADGHAYVVLESGGDVAVTVLLSQGGIAIVDGLNVGDVVVLPDGATADQQAEQHAPTSSSEP